jgi:phosphatidylglycerophosphate synthase
VVATALTLLRLALAPALVFAIARESPLAASAIFFAAVATDFADGHVARRSGVVAPWGGLFDHGVDAVFCTAGTAALACAGVLPVLLPPLIAIAFLQYALDSRWQGGEAAAQRAEGERRRPPPRLAPSGLRASSLGRFNGIAYYVVVAIPIVRDALGLGWPGPLLVRLIAWGLVATTAASILDRVRLLLRARSARALASE